MTRDQRPSSQRRAGQRPDELLPDENSEAPMKGDVATGSPGGEVGGDGLAGLPADDGAPGDPEQLDFEDPNEPQSGRAGGAVGGTPVNKRAVGD